MRALAQLTLANTREFTRDRAALFWTFAFPLLFVLIFGLVFSRDSATQYEIGLINEDESPQASVLVDTLEAIDVFDLSRGSLADEIASLEDGDRRAVIAIPSGFGASIDAGTPASVDIHYDETRQSKPAGRRAGDPASVRGRGSRAHAEPAGGAAGVSDAPEASGFRLSTSSCPASWHSA